ncbi:MAG: biopolymer transporter ExbD [Deltaproteobacteria bacterium]|nr:biopolymer transporter ExbD [Deltaproteobacteria bacterium]
MAGGTGGDDEELISAINVTPLVDVMLVLLIVLMLTASFIATRAIPVDLPRASSGESLQTTYAISLTRDGKIWLDAREVTEARLRQLIGAARRRDRDPRVVIAADREVSHGKVVRIIDLVRRLGVTKFAINIQPEDAAGRR